MPGKLVPALSLLMITILLFSGCWGPEEEEEKAIGVLHLERLLAESKTARSYQEELDARGEELREKHQLLAEELDEYTSSRKQDEAYQEFVSFREELEAELNQRIEEVVKGITEEKNLKLVLEKESIRYGGVDITELVIERLD